MAPPNAFKPAALPLMEAGKAMATAGEMWVDLISSSEFITSFFAAGDANNYNNNNNNNNKISSTEFITSFFGAGDANNNNNNNNKALYACGVQLRNAGDALAQAAATGRFAYGMEMTCNELRESASCFRSATNLLQQAVTNAKSAVQQEDGSPPDNEDPWSPVMDRTIAHFTTCSTTLEAAGAGIMQRRPYPDIGTKLLECGQAMQGLASVWSPNNDEEGNENDATTAARTWSPSLVASSQSLGRQFALVASGLEQAGTNLQPTTATTTKSSTRPW